MPVRRSSPLLRGALLTDALASGAMALLLLAFAGGLTGLLGIDPTVMHGVGLFLLPYTAFVGYLGSRQSLTAALVWVVIAGNTLWVVTSIAILVDSLLSPTVPGTVFVIAQATMVGVLAELQYLGMQRSSPVPA